MDKLKKLRKKKYTRVKTGKVQKIEIGSGPAAPQTRPHPVILKLHVVVRRYGSPSAVVSELREILVTTAPMRPRQRKVDGRVSATRDADQEALDSPRRSGGPLSRSLCLSS